MNVMQKSRKRLSTQQNRGTKKISTVTLIQLCDLFDRFFNLDYWDFNRINPNGVEQGDQHSDNCSNPNE